MLVLMFTMTSITALPAGSTMSFTSVSQAANENADDITVLNFASNGYRTQFAVIFDMLASLNESQRIN